MSVVATEANTLMRLATAGSVDDGKSTLVGRLLHDTKSVLSDQLAAVERVSRERGLTAADLALLTDGLRAEREQGITIDVAYRYFATATRSFVLADCPGHVQYTRNTVTGASTADVIVLLVDARKGVLEQTRRHLAVAALLRVPHVVVAVNKIDLVGFSEEAFRGAEADVRAVARELGVADARAIPVSALDGDNVVVRSARTPWYDGPALLELLETLPPSSEPVAGSFRLPVQLVIRPQGAARDAAHRDYRGYAGQVASGVVRVGDEVVVLPSGLRTTVAGIDLGEHELREAFAPQSVSVRLADDLDVSRGDVIASASDAPRPVRDVAALVCWLGDRPLRPDARLLLKHGARTVQAILRTIEGRLDLDDLHSVAADSLSLNDIGPVAIRLAQPLPVEDYAVSRSGGAFLLVDPDDGATVAAGMATDERRPALDGAPAVRGAPAVEGAPAVRGQLARAGEQEVQS
jgi:sulfate adenylyltransferase subunit 1